LRGITIFLYLILDLIVSILSCHLLLFYSAVFKYAHEVLFVENIFRRVDVNFDFDVSQVIVLPDQRILKAQLDHVDFVVSEIDVVAHRLFITFRLLQDHVNLEVQIFNLYMILDFDSLSFTPGYHFANLNMLIKNNLIP
jgi:hypothetical protein